MDGEKGLSNSFKTETNGDVPVDYWGYCSFCGEAIPSDSNFCPFCGADLIQSTPPPPPSSAHFAVHSRPNNGKKKKFNKKKLLIGSVIAIVMILIILIVFGLYLQKKEQAMYQGGLELLESGDYGSAKALFVTLDSSSFPDLDELIADCDMGMKYADAGEAYEAEEYYRAYKLFLELEDYNDSESRAQSCIQSPPSTGTSYYEGSYAGRDCSLLVIPPFDGSSTYIKIYEEDGALICSVFINPGDTAVVGLSAGRYILKSAYGYGPWFGKKDMFGDEGTYEKLNVTYGDETFEFEKNYNYTLTLRTGTNSSGDGVATEIEDRSDF